MLDLEKFLFVASTVLASLTASAQSTRILVPIVATEASGAFDSRWTSELTGFNNSDGPVIISFNSACSGTCVGGIGLKSGQAADLDVFTGTGVPAALLSVPAISIDAIEFGLRVRDVSQQSDSWGTELPIVREDHAFQRPFDLLNVPLPSRFRQTLRVYDFEGQTGGVVRIEYFDMAKGSLLKTFLLALPARASIFTPGYLQFDQFAQVPELFGIDRIRVRISPTNDAQRLWAMVSVTNNVTQELTMITPQ